MARIRSIKPEMRTSEVVASWPREVRYAFALLWGYLDDKGRGLDVPKTIAGDLFPHDEDVTPAKMGRWLKLMATPNSADKPAPICRYEVGGRLYLHATNWKEHQRINRPTTSRLPPCPLHEPLTESSSEDDSEPGSESGSESLNGSSVRGAGEQGSRGAGEVGAGGPRSEPLTQPAAATRPQSRCPQHLDHPDPPACGACADARKARQAYDRDQAGAAAADQASRARERAAATRAAIDACQQCDQRGYLAGGAQLCAHDPANADRTARGAAQARAALHPEAA